jgi:predicted dehydrogenase
MKILIIGNGMYISGRGTNGFGTVMPGVLEYIRGGGDVIEVHMVGTNLKRSLAAASKVEELMRQAGVSVKLITYPDNVEKDKKAYKKVLNKIENLTCAIVSVPDNLHFSVTMDCLEAGLHTLVVKPLTPTVKEAKDLIKLATNKKLYGAVEFHKRWDKHNLMLRDIFQSGRLGDPLYSWTEYSQRKSIPSQAFKSWVEKSNVLQYLGVHYIDIIHFVTGAAPIRVMATGQKNWLKNQGFNVHDSIQCMVEWKMPDSTIFNQTLLTNWVDPETSSAVSDQKIRFVGTKGRFEADQKDRGINLIVDGESIVTPNPDFCQSYGNKTSQIRWEGYGIESIITFLKDVNAIVNNNKFPASFEGNRPTFKESIISTAVIEAVVHSLSDHGNWKPVEGF